MWRSTVTPAEIIEAAQLAAGFRSGCAIALVRTQPGRGDRPGVRAIAPLVIFLFLVLKLVLRDRLPNPGEIFYGIGLTIIGMCIFNIGLTYGLSKLGGNAGGMVPAAFMEIDGIANSPMYVYVVGLVIAWPSPGFWASAQPSRNLH